MNAVADTLHADKASEDPHALQCMEIWGGNRATRRHASVSGIDAYVYSQPYDGQSAGGDIHYVSMCGSGRVVRFAVADVSGHGDAVGGLATELRSLVRKHINKVDQTRFVRSLNEEFSRLAEAGMFATAVLATYFAPTDHLIVVNAGHPTPFWYSAKENAWRRLESSEPSAVTKLSNLPLGIIDPTEYCQFAVPLAPQDRILVYTDSLIEATSPAGQQLGEEGLLALLGSLPLTNSESMCESLLRRITEYRGGRSAEDDVTLLLLQHNAKPHARQSLVGWSRSIARMLGLMSV